MTDHQIVRARQALWDHRRVAVEHGAATALAALLGPDQHTTQWDTATPGGQTGHSYRPGSGEKVVVVLCGANTDPSDLVQQVDQN